MKQIQGISSTAHAPPPLVSATPPPSQGVWWGGWGGWGRLGGLGGGRCVDACVAHTLRLWGAIPLSPPPVPTKGAGSPDEVTSLPGVCVCLMNHVCVCVIILSQGKSTLGNFDLRHPVEISTTALSLHSVKSSPLPPDRDRPRSGLCCGPVCVCVYIQFW